MRGNFNLRPLDAIICSNWTPNDIIAAIAYRLIDGGYSIYYDAEHAEVGMDLIGELYEVIGVAPLSIYFYPLFSNYDFIRSDEYYKDEKAKEKLLVVLPQSDFVVSSLNRTFSEENTLQMSTHSNVSIDQIAFKIGMKIAKIIGKPKRPRIFLCHAHEDFQKVQDLYTRLQLAGFEAWYDKENLDVGDIWEGEITKSIAKTDFFAICMSNTSIKKKGFIDNEIKLAIKEFQNRNFDNAFILPIRLENCEIPNMKIGEYNNLNSFQWIDLWEKGFFDKLINGLWKHWNKLLGNRLQ